MKVRDEDIEITHVRGSGPGGQNRNKRWSGVRIVHVPTGLVVTATERRSQHQNLEAARGRLEEKLRILFTPKKARIAVKKPRAATERRLSEKRKRSERKTGRGHVEID